MANTVNANGTLVAQGGAATTTPVKAALITVKPLKELRNNEGNVLNNTATIGDVISFNLQGNSKDFVCYADTVSFVNGQGAAAVGETDSKGEVSTIRIDVDKTEIVTAPTRLGQ